MFDDMFSKVLVGLVLILVVVIAYLNLVNAGLEAENGKAKLQVANAEVNSTVLSKEKTLTGIAEYANGKIYTIDKEQKDEKVITFGKHRKSF